MDEMNPTDPSFSSLEAVATTLQNSVGQKLTALRILEPSDAPDLASEIADELAEALDES